MLAVPPANATFIRRGAQSLLIRNKSFDNARGGIEELGILRFRPEL